MLLLTHATDLNYTHLFMIYEVVILAHVSNLRADVVD
jgi:hypothetical protein